MGLQASVLTMVGLTCSQLHLTTVSGDLILASGVGVAATPWQLTSLHHEEKEDTCYSAIVLHFHCLLAVYLYIVSGLENFYNLSFMMDDHVYIIQHIIHVGYTCATEMLT